MRMSRWAVALVAMLAAIAGVGVCAGCSAGAAVPGAKASAAVNAGGSGVAACAAGDLRLGTAPTSGAFQHDAKLLTFTDTGARSCYVRGYPRVALLRSNGTTFGLAKQSASGFYCRISSADCPDPTTAVRLAPGQEAVALFEWMDANDQYGGADDAAACSEYGVVAIRFTDPGAHPDAGAGVGKATVSSSTATGVGVCGDAVVHAVTAEIGTGA